MNNKSLTTGASPRLAALAILGFIWFSGTPGALADGPGFPNIDRPSNDVGSLLAGPLAREMGRTAIIIYHQGHVMTVPELASSSSGSDNLIRIWDISDPENPTFDLGPRSYNPPFNAHGYIKLRNHVLTAGGYWTDRNGVLVSESSADGERTGVSYNFNRSAAAAPWSATLYWSYGDTNQDTTLYSGGSNLEATIDVVGETGVVGHPFIFGNYLIYASDQSSTGVAIYDISDPQNPNLVGLLKSGEIGGYWPEIFGNNGKLYLVFPQRNSPEGRLQVVDITDPTNPFLAHQFDVPGNLMYCQFQDEYCFAERYKFNLSSMEIELTLDEDATTVDGSQFSLPVGNLLLTGGLNEGGSNGNREGLGIWVHQAEADRRPPTVGYHIPRADQTNYPLRSRISLLIHETLESSTIINGDTFKVMPLDATGQPGAPMDGKIIFSFDDMLNFTPAGNSFEPNTTYLVELRAGGIEDVSGNGIEGYSFRFSTGSGLSGGNAAPVVDALTASAYPALTSQDVTFTAAATDAEDVASALQYRFDFGDGSPKTDWLTTASASHAYPEEGHYTVVVQVRDSEGSVGTRTTVTTVLSSIPSGQPANSSPITVDASGRRVWSVNPDNDSVTLMDADSLAVIREINVAADPRNIAVDPSGNAWVTCFDGDAIQVVAPSGAILATIDTGYGSAPYGIVMNPTGTTAYATLSGPGHVIALDIATRMEFESLPLGLTARALALSADGTRLLVTRFISPDEGGEVWDVATTGGLSLTRTMVLPLNPGPDTTASGRGLPNYLAGIAISPDGRQAWVTAKKDNIEAGLFNDGTLSLDSDNTVRALICVIDLVTNAEDMSLRRDIDNSDSPRAVAFSPFGDYAFVPLQGNNVVSVFDTLQVSDSLGITSQRARLATGLAPQGVVFDPVSHRLLAKNFMDRSVTSFEMVDLLETGDFSPSGTTIQTVTTEALAPAVLLGKQIFYNADDPRMSAEGYISCATCHVDGAHDGRTWDFTQRGEGLRNTTDLRGRSGTGHGRVHWTANFDEIQDFENDIRGGFGGLGFLTDTQFTQTSDPLGASKMGLSADLDALAAYVTSLNEETLPKSPYRSMDGTMTPEALAGKAVFESLNCVSCHGGSSFTDSTVTTATLHDLGSFQSGSGQRIGGVLTGLDTPTLLSVWDTAPYFHHGKGTYLEEVFSMVGGVTFQAETDGALNTSENSRTKIASNAYARHGAFVEMKALGSVPSTLRFDQVDGGAGGNATLRLRHGNSRDRAATIRVNGVSTEVTLPGTGTYQPWARVDWKTFDLPINLVSGTQNTIEIVNSIEATFGIDQIFISSQSNEGQANAHTQVSALSATDQQNLIEYLLQLDGRPDTGSDPDPDPNPEPGNILFADDFSDTPSNWVFGSGNWTVSNGELVQSSNTLDATAVTNQADAATWSNYSVKATITSNDNDTIGFVFYYQDADNHYRIVLNHQSNTTGLEKVVNGNVTPIATLASSYTMGAPFELTVLVDNGMIRVLVDDADIFGGPVFDDTFTSGNAGVYNNYNAGSIYDDFVVSIPVNELLSENFDEGVPNDWVTSGGAWTVGGGEARQSNNALDALYLYNGTEALDWSNYTVSAKLRSEDDDGIGIAFYMQDIDNYYRVNMNLQSDSSTLQKVVNGAVTTLATVPTSYLLNEDFTLEVSIESGLITVLVDGVDLFGTDIFDDTFVSGTVGLYNRYNQGSNYDDVTVTAQSSDTFAFSLYAEAEAPDHTTGFSPLAVLTDDSLASGGAHIAWPGSGQINSSPDDTDSGQAGYTLTLDGDVNVLSVWARIDYANAGDDSFYFKMEGLEDWQLDAGPTNGWEWVKLASYPGLAAGEYTFKVLVREDGSKLDTLYFATDGSQP